MSNDFNYFIKIPSLQILLECGKYFPDFMGIYSHRKAQIPQQVLRPYLTGMVKLC